MNVCSNSTKLKECLADHWSKKTIGFVPTMGALHEGHLSLVKSAQEKFDLVVVSIFVNPTQFNDQKDLEKYPRTLETDLKKLQSIQCDVVYTPGVQDVYPNGFEINRKFDLSPIDSKLEGKYRPGHFDGVAQVVSRLLELVKPTAILLGQKDFQQFRIIEKMIEQLEFPVKAIMCPTAREKNGLAMSSRNIRLTKEERSQASILYETLSWIKKNGIKGNLLDTIEIAKNRLKESEICKELEYLEIISVKDLEPLKNWDFNEPTIACIAMRTENVRLIDNLSIIS